MENQEDPCEVGQRGPVSRDEPHHYHFTHYECPICGRGDTLKTRCRGPRLPRSDNAALDYYHYHEMVVHYDYCDQ